MGRQLFILVPRTFCFQALLEDLPSAGVDIVVPVHVLDVGCQSAYRLLLVFSLCCEEPAQHVLLGGLLLGVSQRFTSSGLAEVARKEERVNTKNYIPFSLRNDCVTVRL